MPCSCTGGPTGNTSQYILCKPAVCNIVGYFPNSGCALMEINRVAEPVQVVIAPAKKDR